MDSKSIHLKYHDKIRVHLGTCNGCVVLLFYIWLWTVLLIVIIILFFTLQFYNVRTVNLFLIFFYLTCFFIFLFTDGDIYETRANIYIYLEGTVINVILRERKFEGACRLFLLAKFLFLKILLYACISHKIY